MLGRFSQHFFFTVALILHIETATTVCSVALAQDGKLLSLKEENKGFTHAENITLFISHVLKESGKLISDLDAVAVSSGPGSYTGLRIGFSTAKGICYALEKPLLSVSSLKSLAANALKKIVLPVPHAALFCPMIDARRMEVYGAMYNEHLNDVEKVSAKIIDENSFSDALKEKVIYFFGDGAEKCKTILAHHPNAIFVDDVFPSASSMISMAEEKFRNK
ncbi:MAG: tRNA (adenosine(37)-N6)-threonylcarbamoyltransferase complex dimerization subunit type 1 TsaB, partial [Bacteroidetes bacterium]|nr:tRNA (adenosine(37)-N6)-threonylcarbamoyltransferase complex dimerization subunit type 1 TsaB [Bacteroidota bacterium]